MSASIISRDEKSITLQLKISLSKSMLEGESQIQDGLNDIGVLATGELLSKFDTDGKPIQFGAIKMTSKGKISKQYQTPYGQVEVKRHVYQSNAGGVTFCPLDRDARIVVSSTPRFAKQVSQKFSEMASTQVQKDLLENHNRAVARSYLQNITEAVGTVVSLTEDSWEYKPEILEKKVKTVSIGMDATCMLLCKDGYKHAVVGTISLYDRQGDRLHTTYAATPPESGKKQFKDKFEREILRIKDRYPNANYLGIADGAKENWLFLKPHTDYQILDFWHVTEYLSGVSKVIFPRDKSKRQEWLDDRCHKLKHKTGMAKRLLNEMQGIDQSKISKVAQETLQAAISYFSNNHKAHRMNYAHHVKSNHPIGSGVTEAACKVIVKQRLCTSGMKWKNNGAGIVLRLRTLVHSGTHWKQFWNKINQYGFPVAA